MRIAALNEQIIGERLGHNITDPAGHILLRAGVRLNRRYVELLQARGYLSVPVHDPLAPDVLPPEAVREETGIIARAAVQRSLKGAAAPRRPVAATVRSVVDRIIADIEANAALTYNVSALRSVQDTLLTHSVNVCVYSVILAATLGMEREDIRHLGVGALLHDIGKVYYLDLVNKPGALEPAEFERLKHHTTDGYQLLRSQKGIHLFSAHAAYQHHERCDGHGYPRGLDHKQIHPWALIVAVADVYDTITGDRPYGVGLPAPAAMAELRQEAERGHLAPQLVLRFTERVAAYPEGSILLLESGQIAVVTQQTPRRPDAPQVRVLTDAHLNLVQPYPAVLRGQTPATTVRSVLPDYPPKVREQFRLARRA